MAQTAAARVDLPGGPVTLEPLDRLTAEAGRLSAEAQAELERSNAAIAAAQDKLAQAGALLTDHRDGWDHRAVAAEAAAVARLKDQGAAVAAELSALYIRDRGGLSGAFHSLLDGHHRQELEKQRAALAERLQAALTALADKAPATTVPEADSLRASAQASLQEAHAALDRQHAALEHAQTLAGEIQRRQTAAKEMGFDALYTAAWLEANGPAPIESPLALKAKEQAYVAMPAVLARITTRTRYVGGGQGMSFPIGHTGIRYRVGSFSGHPVTSTSMADVDEGTLVLSNQRVVFIGRLKSVVTPLPKIVHVESYSDALAVFQEGRENPNFYKLSAPQYFLLYLNWVLGHQG